MKYRFVKIKYNNNVYPNFYLVVDDNFVWTDEEFTIQINKGRTYVEMAFYDHDQILVPDVVAENLATYTPPYLYIKMGQTVLVSEGGQFMTLVSGMEIIEEVILDKLHYPIKEGAAIICENEGFDKYHGSLNHMFKNMYPPAKDIHYMFSFKNRSESEIVDAFKKASAILFYTTFTSVDWWELLLRCYIKSKSTAPIITKLPTSNGYDIKRHELCINMASKFGIDVYNGFHRYEMKEKIK